MGDWWGYIGKIAKITGGNSPLLHHIELYALENDRRTSVARLIYVPNHDKERVEVCYQLIKFRQYGKLARRLKLYWNRRAKNDNDRLVQHMQIDQEIAELKGDKKSVKLKRDMNILL